MTHETDWENDSELKALRDDYVASFDARISALDEAVRGGSVVELKTLAHRLAGTAGTYGFDSLTRAGAALEDWLGNTSGPPDVQVLARFGSLLVDMLSAARESRRDPSHLLQDPRMKELTSAASGTPSGAKS